MPTPEALKIADKYDRELDGLSQDALDRIFRAYDASFRNLLKELRKAYPKLEAAGAISALVRKGAIAEELGQALQLLRPEDAATYQQQLEELLSTTSKAGVSMAEEVLKLQGSPLGTFSGVPVGAIRAQATEFRQRLYRYSERQATRISATVEQGLTLGWGTRKTEAALKKTGVKFKSDAETVARTEVLSSYNSAAHSRYQEAGVELFQWIANPSERICSTCSARNGNVYKLSASRPPSHARCRCTTLAVLDLSQVDGKFYKEYREEGLADLKAAGGKPNYGLSPFEKAAGLEAAPKPVWQPGDKVPTAAAKPKTPKAPKPTAPPPAPPSGKLPANTVAATDDPRITAAALDSALDVLASMDPGTAARVERFRRFAEARGAQAVFQDSSKPLDPKRMRQTIEALDPTNAKPVRELQDGYKAADAAKGATRKLLKKLADERAERLLGLRGAAGFTYMNTTRYVVVESLPGNGKWEVTPDSVRGWADKVLDKLSFATDYFDLPGVTGSGLGRNDPTRTLGVYLHEMGHQVHAAAGEPKPPADMLTPTKYAASDPAELAAEAFALYLMDSKGYKARDPLGHDWVEEMLNQVAPAPVAPPAPAPAPPAAAPPPAAAGSLAKAEWKKLTIPGEDAAAKDRLFTAEVDGKTFFAKQVGKKNIEREIAASEIAKELGLSDLVPEAQRVSIRGKDAVATPFIKGKSIGNGASDKPVKSLSPSERGRILAFDYLIGNADRHSSNVFISDDNKIVLIDHDKAFTTDTRFNPANKIGNRAFIAKNHFGKGLGKTLIKEGDELRQGVTETPLPKTEIERIAQNRAELEQMLKNAGINPKHFNRRLDNLLAADTIEDLILNEPKDLRGAP